MRITSLLALVLTTFGFAACSEPEDPEPINVIVLMADDLGWGDTGFTGGDLPTPEIDRLAREGTTLDRFYCQPKCSPTRAGVLTGRHPIRFGMQHNVVTPWETHGLPTSERTLAEAFDEAGYPHRALFGKWHLGHAKAEHHPLEHGFTEFVGHMNGRIDYFTHMAFSGADGKPGLDWMRGRELEHANGQYVTDLVTTEAVNFLKRRAGDGEPFFMMVPFLAPHWPNQAPEDWVELFDDLPEPRRTYAAKVAAMDAAIGRIRRTLDDQGLSQNTLVLFMSDNGADPTKGGSNKPLRGKKHTAYEGGVRCPAILRMPGTVPRGAHSDALSTYIDIFPTFGEVVGFEPGDVDGRDRWKQWTESVVDAVPNEHFVYMRARNGGELVSLQGPEFKLIRTGKQPWDMSMPREKVVLLRYREDVLERGDCQKAFPEVCDQMLRRLAALRSLGTHRGDPQIRHSVQPPDGWQWPADWRPGLNGN